MGYCASNIPVFVEANAVVIDALGIAQIHALLALPSA